MRQFTRACCVCWVEIAEFFILFGLFCYALVLWDNAGHQSMNSLTKQAILILLWAIIATLGPWFTAFRFGKNRRAHWSTLNFSIPFLLVVVPPVLFSVILDSRSAISGLEENFVKVFFPLFGSAMVVMVMVHVLVIVEMWDLPQGNSGQGRILPWMPICIGVIGLGMLFYGMCYYADAHADLDNKIKLYLFYFGYLFSTMLSLFGLGLLIWLEP